VGCRTSLRPAGQAAAPGDPPGHCRPQETEEKMSFTFTDLCLFAITVSLWLIFIFGINVTNS
jgi:hypothetical protein